MADEEIPSCSVKIKNVFVEKNGGNILLRGGHQYYARRKHNSGLIVWACTKRKLCKGLLRMYSQNENIIAEKSHQCTPDFAKNEIDENLHNLKQELKSDEFPSIPHNFNKMMAKIKDSGLDIVSEVPTFISKKSNLYRQRNKAAGVSKIQVRTVMEVEIPLKYQDFLLADYTCNSRRIVIFSSARARNAMCEVRNFYGDGTFKSCPFPFSELYTIHGDTGSTLQQTSITPLIYALMSDRKTEAYELLFSLIKSQLPGWKPETFKSDYEMATMNAVSKIFPGVVVKGCYFHYNQAVFKKGRELKLTQSEDIKKKRMVKLSAVLPLLPQKDIINGWVYINARYGSKDPETEQFVKYMEKQWLREDFIPTWCVFGEAHRTTNALESWHSKLNKIVGKKNPNMMHLLHILKQDASLYSFQNGIKQLNAIKSKTKRAKKTVSKDELIQEAQQELIQGEVTVGHVLEILRN